MRRVDTSVDDVGASACTGAVVVSVGRAAAGFVRDTGNTPRSARLGGVGVEGDDGILLDEFDLGNKS